VGKPSPYEHVFSYSDETRFSRSAATWPSHEKDAIPMSSMCSTYRSWDIDILSIRSDRLPSVRRSRIKYRSFSSDQPNHLSNRRPVHSWNRGWRGSMQLSYWNFFGRPTVRVEKLQIIDTIIPSVAWAETRLRQSYFVWYLIYGGLLEEDVSYKGQTSWRVEHSWVNGMRKGKEGDKTNLTCCCSQYRYCKQGHRPFRGVWASAMSPSMLAILM